MTIDESIALRNIQLKTVDGVPVNYDQVKYIDVPTQDGRVSKYMSLTVGMCYYATVSTIGDNNYYTIKGEWIYNHYGRTFIAAFTDVLCQEVGKKTSTGAYQLLVVITHKQLEVGKTYSEDEL